MVGLEQEDLPMSASRALSSRIVTLVLPLLLAACSNMRTIRIPLPPRVDLAAYPTIGLITFSSSNGDVELERRCTQRFLAAMQEAQPGTRVVELGGAAEVLGKVHRSALDSEAIRAIQSSWSVAAVLTGKLEIGKTRPQVNVSSMWINNVNVRADVDVGLSARLIETASTATVWTDSAQRTENVASADVSQHGSQGSFGFGVRDPQAIYDGVINALVFEITDAFRSHYELRRVPKDEAAPGNANGQ